MESERPSSPFRELISVVSEREETLCGETRTNVFVKLYVAARESGLIRELGPELWQTLCVIATRMNGERLAWPSQATVARDLGISEKQAQRRIKKLEAFRFQGHPLIRLKGRVRTGSGTWKNNVYELFPASGFGIFDQAPERSTPHGRGMDEATPHAWEVGSSSIPHGRGVAEKQPLEPVESDRNPSGPLKESARRRPKDPRPRRSSIDPDALSTPHAAGDAGWGTNKKQSINKNTHSVCFDLSSRGEGESAPEALVREFLRVRKLSRTRPKERELHQASELIEEYGAEAARFVLDYALREAPSTGFEMQNFGAVFEHLEPAIEAMKASESARRAKKGRARKEQLRELFGEFEQWRSEVVSAQYDGLTEGELCELEARAKRRLLKRYEGSERFVTKLLIECSIKEELASDIRFPSFEEWVREKAA